MTPEKLYWLFGGPGGPRKCHTKRELREAVEQLLAEPYNLRVQDLSCFYGSEFPTSSILLVLKKKAANTGDRKRPPRSTVSEVKSDAEAQQQRERK
jgi:hypothetical protein